MFGKTEPGLMNTLLLEELDIGLEGISVSPDGEMQKCILVLTKLTYSVTSKSS